MMKLVFPLSRLFEIQEKHSEIENVTFFRDGNQAGAADKVGCIFPIVLWPEFRKGQYRDGQENVPYFMK